MWLLSDQAKEEWSFLVEREEHMAYKVQPSSSSLEDHDRQPQQGHSSLAHDNINHSCPSVWREKICEWCFQVTDHCNIDRDVVSIALSYFDRYTARNTSIDETLYQLVAMTSLYLAVKLHSMRKISVSSMSTLSKGYFRVDQILKMEICIIKSLRWHLNPPTSSIFLNIANPLICDACTMDPQASYEIAEISRYLLELSVCDGYFIDKSPSSVTCASILIAMEHLSTPDKTRRKFGSYKLDQKSPQVTELCVQRLRDVYNLAMPTQTEEVQEPPRAGSSPISVFNG